MRGLCGIRCQDLTLPPEKGSVGGSMREVNEDFQLIQAPGQPDCIRPIMVRGTRLADCPHNPVKGGKSAEDNHGPGARVERPRMAFREQGLDELALRLRDFEE
jgi:hypothetical protein